MTATGSRSDNPAACHRVRSAADASAPRPGHRSADTAFRGRQAEDAVPLRLEAIGAHPGDHRGGLAGEPALQLPFRHDPERPAVGRIGAQQHLLGHRNEHSGRAVTLTKSPRMC